MIPSLVILEKNSILILFSDKVEMRAVMGVPSLDGFIGDYFNYCWDVVSSDRCRAVQ